MKHFCKNQISASHNNEFIKLIVEEKGANAERLVAIYAVPDLGNNFVLEFDNKRDDNGKIIRSPKTLKKIYRNSLTDYQQKYTEQTNTYFENMQHEISHE